MLDINKLVSMLSEKNCSIHCNCIKTILQDLIEDSFVYLYSYVFIFFCSRTLGPGK